MKFIIVGKNRPGVAPPPNYKDLLTTAKQWIETKQADGLIECVYGLIPRGNLAIVNVESLEALWTEIVTYPLYPFLDFKVRPLVDAKFVIEKSLAML